MNSTLSLLIFVLSFTDLVLGAIWNNVSVSILGAVGIWVSYQK